MRMKHKFIFPIKLNKKLHIVIMCKFLFWEIDATKFVKSKETIKEFVDNIRPYLRSIIREANPIRIFGRQ